MHRSAPEIRTPTTSGHTPPLNQDHRPQYPFSWLSISLRVSSLSLLAIRQVGDEMGPKGSHAAVAAAAAAPAAMVDITILIDIWYCMFETFWDGFKVRGGWKFLVGDRQEHMGTHPTISQPYPNHIQPCPTIPNHTQPYPTIPNHICKRRKRVLAYWSFGEAQFFLKKRAFSFGEERELYVCTPTITVRTWVANIKETQDLPVLSENPPLNSYWLLMINDQLRHGT